MIAELGLFLLWLAAAMSLLQVFATYAAYVGGKKELTALILPAAVTQAVLSVASFAALTWVFIISDFSVRLVAANSHIEKPLVFKVAATWGNHEGSMLLWVTILSICGGAIALLPKRMEERTTHASIAMQGLLALGFFSFLLFASNPFERLVPAANSGLGLNPLLQDLGLAFHPPTLYLGYVGLSVAFSFAVGALITGEIGPKFARAMRPWVLGAWIFLTLGITAGSYWAYYELGWGGWWFWDPVENASLMPWLAATALLHSVTVLATRDALRAWTIMLALLAFAMSMAGTFLVRSGILTSVHAFAVDPKRGAFILALMLLYVGAAFVLFALRIGKVQEGKAFKLVSREGGIVLNNLLISSILGIVLVGTLFPLVAEAMGDKISVGPPYYVKTTLPLMLILLVGMATGPLLKWRENEGKAWAKPLIVPAIVAASFGLFLVAQSGASQIVSILAIALSIGLVVASFLPLLRRNLRRTPLAIWGMAIAHAGIGISGIGMASEAGFSKEQLGAIPVGGTTNVGDWTVTVQAVRPTVGANWTAIEGELVVIRGADKAIILPQIRYFQQPVQTTNESAILTRWNGQLYAVIAPVEGANAGKLWQVRLWWKPFVTLIWAGGTLIALGGFLALVGRLWRRKPKVEKNPWAAI